MRVRLCLLVLASLACGLQCAAGGPVAETKGQGKVGVVRFDDWTQDEDTPMQGTYRYEVRKGKGASADELIFSVVIPSYDDEGREQWTETPTSPPDTYLSGNHQAVSLDGQFKTRDASAAEWKEGAKLLHGRRQLPANVQLPPSAARSHTDKAVLYQGKSYARSGESWGNPVALVSPRGKWLAVFSYTAGGVKPPAVAPPIAAPEAGDGELYVDVYDLSKGERVIAGRAPYTNNAPSLLLGGALWVEDQYLLMPLDNASRTCLLGIAPH
jgi:hypothetical protein